jgi:hypothetical protein
MATRIFRLAALAAVLLAGLILPGGAAQAVTISFTSSVETAVRYFDGSGTYLDVSFGGKPSVPGGPCPTFCTADLTEGVQGLAATNVELWGIGPSPSASQNETQLLSYDLSITLDGMTLTETILHSMNVSYPAFSTVMILEVLGGPVTTFDFGAAGKIDVWVPTSRFGITQGHDGSGIQFNTNLLLYDVGAVPVPEPASAALLLSGIGIAAVLRRRRRAA